MKNRITIEIILKCYMKNRMRGALNYMISSLCLSKYLRIWDAITLLKKRKSFNIVFSNIILILVDIMAIQTVVKSVMVLK